MLGALGVVQEKGKKEKEEGEKRRKEERWRSRRYLLYFDNHNPPGMCIHQREHTYTKEILMTLLRPVIVPGEVDSLNFHLID